MPSDRETLSKATHIDVDAEVRYWEDASVNGVEDTNGDLIPGRVGDLWQVRIDLLQGRIEAWPEGISADIHYKVCDQGLYWLSDASGARLAQWKGHYVPGAFLCHGDNGYGDYIIMKVALGGHIESYRIPAINASEWTLTAPPPEGSRDGR